MIDSDDEQDEHPHEQAIRVAGGELQESPWHQLEDLAQRNKLNKAKN